jgi:hypothetical protein
MLFPMPIESILAQIDAEIATLVHARSLLSAAGSVSTKAAASKGKKKVGRPRKKRVLSPEARKRIADAQRKRWAAQKAKAK